MGFIISISFSIGLLFVISLLINNDYLEMLARETRETLDEISKNFLENISKIDNKKEK
jgi:hypothetical protein